MGQLSSESGVVYITGSSIPLFSARIIMENLHPVFGIQPMSGDQDRSALSRGNLPEIAHLT
jgi:hypothetical protein